MTRKRSGRRTIICMVAASAVAGDAMEQPVVSDKEQTFFDLSGWSHHERNELRDHALAIRDLDDNIDWRRHIDLDEVEAYSAKSVQGRRRLLSEEEFLRDAEDEWDADFRSVYGGKDRDGVIGAGGNPGGVRRKAQKVTLSLHGKKERTSSGKNFQQRKDFRCIDDSPSNNVPCPPEDLGSACDKYNGGSFLKCYDYCKPSFCCIHDSLSQTNSPSCAKTEPNCPSYFACYIIWWKLHDTIGPAIYLRIEQDEAFYSEATSAGVLDDLAADTPFFQQLFGHHFDTDETLTEEKFLDRQNW